MRGMSAQTGAPLSGLDHLRQSISDILSTPVGSRVLRRAYGSRLPDLIDAPLNPETEMEVYIATAEALQTWEPRLALSRVTMAAPDGANGGMTLVIEGTYLPDGEPLSGLFQIGGTPR
jgi:phage baseplate assembly protein W